MTTCGFRTAARTDDTESDTRQLPRDGRMLISETVQDSSLQLPEVRTAMHINVCMPASDGRSDGLHE